MIHICSCPLNRFRVYPYSRMPCIRDYINLSVRCRKLGELSEITRKVFYLFFQILYHLRFYLLKMDIIVYKT